MWEKKDQNMTWDQFLSSLKVFVKNMLRVRPRVKRLDRIQKDAQEQSTPALPGNVSVKLTNNHRLRRTNTACVIIQASGRDAWATSDLLRDSHPLRPLFVSRSIFCPQTEEGRSSGQTAPAERSSGRRKKRRSERFEGTEDEWSDLRDYLEKSPVLKSFSSKASPIMPITHAISHRQLMQILIRAVSWEKYDRVPARAF